MTPQLTLPHPPAIEFLNPECGFVHTDRTFGLELQLFGSTSNLSYTKLLTDSPQGGRVPTRQVGSGSLPLFYFVGLSILNNYNGYNTYGTWRLMVWDLRAGNIGKLNSWSITFN